MQKHKTYKIVKDYYAGKLDKYEAMDALDVETVADLMSVCAGFDIPEAAEPDPFQSDAEAKPVVDFLNG